jgi:hypothetical protein
LIEQGFDLTLRQAADYVVGYPGGIADRPVVAILAGKPHDGEFPKPLISAVTVAMLNNARSESIIEAIDFLLTAKTRCRPGVYWDLFHDHDLVSMLCLCFCSTPIKQ